MNKQFTDGRWSIYPVVNHPMSPNIGTDDKFVCRVMGVQEYNANAKLICHAPDMFELLETLLSEPIESAIKQEIRELLTRITTL